MDVLQSLNIEFVPESQTRTLHLMERYPNGFHKSLGYDACCHCGDELRDQAVTCVSCKRCKYCSDDCRQMDANPSDEAEDPAQGHSSLICMLLGAIQDDDIVERGDQIGDTTRQAASETRIQSEFESYPETLANLLQEGPCFQSMLSRVASLDQTLSIHVIGASEDAELWDATTPSRRAAMVQAYCSSLEILVNKHVENIELTLVGPDCPMDAIDEVKSFTKSDGKLTLRTVQGLYDQHLLDQHGLARPSVIIFFNPGFTVPDYDWTQTLASIPAGTPFFMTTNSEMEGHADIQYLLDLDKIQTLPRSLVQIFFGDEANDDDGDYQETSFFSENPFSGLRLRQSATMANDIYARNRWVYGGIMDSFDQSKSRQDTRAKRSRAAEAESNSKAGNPALI